MNTSPHEGGPQLQHARQQSGQIVTDADSVYRPAINQDGRTFNIAAVRGGCQPLALHLPITFPIPMTPQQNILIKVTQPLKKKHTQVKKKKI